MARRENILISTMSTLITGTYVHSARGAIEFWSEWLVRQTKVHGWFTRDPGLMRIASRIDTATGRLGTDCGHPTNSPRETTGTLWSGKRVFQLNVYLTSFSVQLKFVCHCLACFVNPRPAVGGGKGPPCGFSEMAPEVLGISFETCHTSPGNNSTPCVKKLGPRS